MPCQTIHLRFRQKTADVGHRAERVAVALARAPGAQLRGEVGRGLPGKRRIAASDPFSPRAVTGGTGLDAAFGVTFEVEDGRGTILDRAQYLRRDRKPGVIGGKALPRGPIHPLGDPAHLRMTPLTPGEKLHLPREVPLIEAGEARDEIAVPLAAQAMAGDAGSLRAGSAAAQRNQLASRPETVFARFRSGTGGKRRHEREERGIC
jgi:hypothetical protein